MQPLEQLESIVKHHVIQLGILTIPAEAAQQLADRLHAIVVEEMDDALDRLAHWRRVLITSRGATTEQQDVASQGIDAAGKPAHRSRAFKMVFKTLQPETSACD